MTENVWHTPRNIYVKAKNSQRKWKFQTGVEDSPVDYVPDFGTVQFFRWKGYWLDVSRLHAGIPYQADMGEFEPPAAPVGYSPDASISLRSAKFLIVTCKASILNLFSAFTRVTCLCYLHS